MCRYYLNNRADPEVFRANQLFSRLKPHEIYRFHSSLPEYRRTPLQSLPNLAQSLRIGQLWIKDESYRFGLNAFKGLGASYAIYKRVQQLLVRKGLAKYDPSDSVQRDFLAGLTFCAATDGNHGRAVAWMAGLIGARAVIFIPDDAAGQRVEAIASLGAEVRLVEGSYDQAVSEVAREAAVNRWEIISDTSTVGDRETAVAISGGYLTLFREIDEQLAQLNAKRPDFLVIQAGVGALAAAAGWHYAKDEAPKLISVEPVQAACLLESASTADQSLKTAAGNLTTIMAGLNCGTPSPVAFDIIKDSFDLFVAIGDEYAEQGMKMLYQPQGSDPKIESGESGAAGLAFLLALEKSGSLKGLRKLIGMNQESSVLLISTEGITDRLNFNRILTKSRA
ncbi:MAG: diaminopropionate ammonia-lyase [bacterium]|nr:diaminopropionate ammonia-lyase [bacterium]